VPTNLPLRSGDVLKLDLGVRFKGYYADAAVTVGIGSISETAQSLISVTNEALMNAIALVQPGVALGDIGFIIQHTTKKGGFQVVKGLTGHGIGRELHADPSVLNEGKRGEGFRLKEGMAIAIEPMVSAGSRSVIQERDESYATADGALSAHFEHTVLVTRDGHDVLTLL